MPSTPLFSTYSQGENRVTSSMLAVFERAGLSLTETILAKASGESTLETVVFTNQPATGQGTIPDARIAADFTYLFEVKTARNAIQDPKQLTGHLKRLDEEQGRRTLKGKGFVFVLTPDPVRPRIVEELADRRLVWFNFAALHDAITAVLDDTLLAPSERDRFLLRELQALFEAEGLISHDDVVVVAAGIAYGEYLEGSAYICQPGRAFRERLTHLGFYAQQAIQPHLARILTRQDHVPFTHEEAQQREGNGGRDARIADLIRSSLETGAREEGKKYMVFLLSGPQDPETVVLEVPLVNDTVAASGRPWAWTMGQRYVSLAALRKPGVRTTSDLGTS
ncbi:hypothetical protein [Nocardiopsis sp. MG754419]|uniref:hypothetical protein n=1 Tax=Nocardiopsis sp. MG754419 TaxID=2259865 RepID=UPI001BAB959C|nr:hypothetical protein [Nocardiopsis sp. MG754419]